MRGAAAPPGKGRKRRTEAAMPARTRPAVLLRSLADLEAYLAARRWLGRHGGFELRLPALAPAERDALERRLNFWREVCGCLSGGLAVLAAMAWQAIALAGSGDRSAAVLAAAAAIVLLTGIAAKIAAIAFARAMLALELERLRGRLGTGVDPRGE